MPSPKQQSKIQIDTKSPEGTPKSNENATDSSPIASTPSPGTATSPGHPAATSTPKTTSPRKKVIVQHVTLTQLSALLTPRGQPIQTFTSFPPSNPQDVKTPRYAAVTIISPLSSPLASPLIKSTKSTTNRAAQLKDETESMQFFLNNTLDNIRDCANRIEHVKSNLKKYAWEIIQHDLSNFKSLQNALASYMKRIVDLKQSDAHLLNTADIATLEQNINKRITDINKIIPIITELKLAVKSQIINIQKCEEILDKLAIELKPIISPTTPTPAAGL